MIPRRHKPAQVSVQGLPPQVSTPQPPAASTNPSSPQTAIPSLLPTTQNLSGDQSTNTNSVTPDQFMSAFKNAIRTQNGQSYASEGSQDSQIPLHVQKQLQQWGQMSYKQRIAEAFRKAGALISRTISSSKPINTVIYLSIPILKNGSLGDISHQSLSGVSEVDRYIVDVLKSAHFPPIPDRFKTSTFSLTLPINLSLKPGTGVYSISVA